MERERKGEEVGETGVGKGRASRRAKSCGVEPVQFVLGVRRTTTGVARSMNINTTFFWNRDVSFDLLLSCSF